MRDQICHLNSNFNAPPAGPLFQMQDAELLQFTDVTPGIVSAMLNTRNVFSFNIYCKLNYCGDIVVYG